MADQGNKFSFFQDIHVRIEIRTDISISIRPMTTKFGKQICRCIYNEMYLK